MCTRQLVLSRPADMALSGVMVAFLRLIVTGFHVGGKARSLYPKLARATKKSQTRRTGTAWGDSAGPKGLTSRKQG